RRAAGCDGARALRDHRGPRGGEGDVRVPGGGTGHESRHARRARERAEAGGAQGPPAPGDELGPPQAARRLLKTEADGSCLILENAKRSRQEKSVPNWCQTDPTRVNSVLLRFRPKIELFLI